LRDFLGTEGHLGVFTELTLKVRKQPEVSSPRIAVFSDPREAFGFIDRLIAGGHRPSHVVFYDRERMAEENRLFFDRTGCKESIVEERDTVLLHFEDRHAENRLLEAETTGSLSGTRRSPAARYLWTERFFPLKAQRLGPGLLAAEVVLARADVPAFIDRARKIAGRFGVQPAIEAIVSKLSEETEACVVIASFPCDPASKWNYMLGLVLVQILMLHGLRLGGRPYGLGIWNAPFAGNFHGPEERRRLHLRKHELDPHSLLNPNKHFAFRTRFLNIPGLLFRPSTFRAALGMASFLSPLIGAAARLGKPGSPSRWLVPAPDEEGGVRLLAQSSARCTSCGSCVSACPAYLLTRDERVTGRAKLRMAESRIMGEAIAAGEAQQIFQCLQCGLCEEVCQTRLPLRDCYDVLESWIRQRQGYPADLIHAFVQKLDADRSLIRAVFSLDLPDWTPAGRLPGLDEVRKSLEAVS
jgi:ferredoxin